MAAIPLPALDIRPPAPPPSPLDQYAQLMQIKNAQNQQALQPYRQQAAQAEAQSAGLGVQQQQIQLDDQKAMSAAMRQWGSPAAAGATGPAQGATPASSGEGAPQGGAAPARAASVSYDDLVPLAIKNGASFGAVKQLSTFVMGLKQQASQIAKNDADAGSAQLSALKARGDLVDGALTPLIDPAQTPDARLPQAIMSTAQDLIQRGVLDPQHAQIAEGIAQGADPTQMRAQLDQFRKMNMAQSQILDDAAKQAGLTASAAQHGPLSPAQIQQLNQGFTQRWQTLHPGQPAPASAQLAAGSTQDDFNRLDKMMSGTEKNTQTVATNALRSQQMGMMAQFRLQGQQMQQNAQLAQSFNYANNFIEKDLQPVQQMAQRVGRLQTTIAQANPQADAIVAPELLSIMAGGMGSGLRMNQAEIERAVGGATNWTKLQASLNKWSTDPTHAQIPPAQRAQINGLVDYVSGQVNEQLKVGTQAQQDLINASTPQQHRQVLGRFQQQFEGTLHVGAAGAAQPQGGGQVAAPAGAAAGNGGGFFSQFGGAAHQ